MRLAAVAEAEPFLTEGAGGLQTNAVAYATHRHDAVERVVRLYDVWEELAPGTGRAARAAPWRKLLAAPPPVPESLTR